MKFITIILPFLLLGLASHAKNLSSGNLSFTTSNKVILLDVDTYSCDDLQNGATVPSLKAISGKTSALKIKWMGTDPLEILIANLDIQGKELVGGKAQIRFSAENMIMPANDSSIHEIPCGLRFGGLPLINKNQSASLTGVIKLTGVTTDSQGNSTIEHATFPINLEYQP